MIHVSSQWLSLLSVPSSKDPQDPRGPRDPQIHRSTEPGSSPDLLDLSYAAMQTLTMLIYCFYRQLLIQHASRNVESVYSQSHFSAHSHLCRTRFDCAAGFALLNLPKGKSLGRSKPATSSYAQALATHCVGFLLYPSSAELPNAK